MAKMKKVVFVKLDAKIVENGMTRKQVCEKMWMSYGTLHGKMTGERPFTLDECLALRDLLAPGMAIEELFERIDKK